MNLSNNYNTTLSPRCYQFLILASLVGDNFDLTILEDLLGEKIPSEVVQEAIEARIIEPDESAYRFISSTTKDFFVNEIEHVHDQTLLKKIICLQARRCDEAHKTIKTVTALHNEGIRVLQFLLNHPAIVAGAWDDALPLITESLYRIIQAHAISIWSYQEADNSLQCEEFFETQKSVHTNPKENVGEKLFMKDYPKYFTALLQDHIVVANDVHNCLVTSELIESYFIPMGLQSMLDVPFFMNGKLAGVICFENKHIYHWTTDEIFFAMSIGTFISLTYQALQRKKSEKLLAEANLNLMNLNNEVLQQNEELKTQSEVIYQKNEELMVANMAIRELNSNLEKIVEQRTHNLQITNAKLVSINEELDTFLYHSAHALRRPLTNILGLLELGKMQEINQEMHKIFGYIDHTVISMDAMLRKLISLSEITNKKIILEKIQLSTFIQHIIAVLEPLANQNQVQINLQVHTDVTFITQTEALKAILLNLIENAIIFSKSATITTVHVTIRKLEDYLEVIVEDTGVGIHEEYHQKIFHLFFRGTALSQGNGLGLYIVKKAVEQLKGVIYLESEPKKGSKFIVRLPYLF